jgi:hypothetical protein
MAASKESMEKLGCHCPAELPDQLRLLFDGGLDIARNA